MTLPIVICGNDKDLLETRAMVLATANFQVELLIGVEALQTAHINAETRLVVLCHSLSDREQNQAIQKLQQTLPKTAILALNSSARSHPLLGAASFDTFEGPQALIALSRQLTSSQAEPYQLPQSRSLISRARGKRL